jgi:hypothetical protein
MSRSTPVAMSETRREPTHPSRLEKKTNMNRVYPGRGVPVTATYIAAPIAATHVAAPVAATPSVASVGARVAVVVVDHDGTAPAPPPTAQHGTEEQAAEEPSTTAEPAAAVEGLASGVDR